MLDDHLFEEALAQTATAIRLRTKIDLAKQKPSISATNELPSVGVANPVPISAVTDVGLSDLKMLLRSRLSTDPSSGGQWLGMTAARCRETLETVAASLERAVDTAQIPAMGDELIVVDLRDALDHLGVILGVIYTDDVLDRIFSKFCIGK